MIVFKYKLHRIKQRFSQIALPRRKPWKAEALRQMAFVKVFLLPSSLRGSKPPPSVALADYDALAGLQTPLISILLPSFNYTCDLWCCFLFDCYSNANFSYQQLSAPIELQPNELSRVTYCLDRGEN